MGLLRTILALVILLILVHIGLFYGGIEQSLNVVTSVIYSLGALVESPGALLLGALGDRTPDFINPTGFLSISLTAAVVYFVLYLLLGIGRN